MTQMIKNQQVATLTAVTEVILQKPVSCFANKVDLLGPFGELTFTTTNKLSSFETIIPFYSKSNLSHETKFKELCEQILTPSNYTSVNISVFNDLLYTIMNINPLIVHNIIYTVSDNETKYLKNTIQTLFDQNEFTLDVFIIKYQEFYNRYQRLGKLLGYYEKNTTRDNNSLTSLSQFALTINYLFYKNVLSAKYNENNGLYSVFGKILESKKITINILLQLFKMKYFYTTLSHIIKYDREIMFNIDADNTFLVNMGSNQEFVKDLVVFIHDKLQQKPLTKTDLQHIYDIINMSSHFNERVIFNMYYQKYLEKRLIMTQFDLEHEQNIISKFNILIDNKFVHNMTHKINDVIDSIKLKQGYVKVNIRKTTDKYKNLDITTLDKNILDVLPIRFYAWDDAQHIEYINYNVPNELQPYIDIYTNYYAVIYPHKQLYWNYNLGYAKYEVDFGTNKYEFQLTLPQLFVLMQFNNKEKISAQELATNLGVTLSVLGPVLNGFLRTKILIRENGSPNDSDLKFYYNKDFKYQASKINLTNLVSTPNNQLVQKQQIDKQVEDEYKIGKNNILSARIVRVLKQQASILDTSKLLELVTQSIPFNVTDELFNGCITNCINNNYIKKIVAPNGSCRYVYTDIVNNSDSDDEDSDNEDSDNEDSDNEDSDNEDSDNEDSNNDYDEVPALALESDGLEFVDENESDGLEFVD
jgi:hypothetical protein